MSKNTTSMMIPEVANLAYKEFTEFKNPALNAYATNIARIYSDVSAYATEKTTQLAITYSELKETKAYEDDGFKSVADFAEQVFGTKRSYAYMLASAGDLYRNPEIHAGLKSLSPTKAAEISALPVDTINEAYEAGTISEDMTQKELRKFRDDTTSKGELKFDAPLPLYKARLVSDIIPEGLLVTLSEPYIMDEWDDIICEYIIDEFRPARAPEVIKLPKCQPVDLPNADKKTVQRKLYITESVSYVIEFYKYEERRVSIEKPKFTREQLLAMLEQMDSQEAE